MPMPSNVEDLNLDSYTMQNTPAGVKVRVTRDGKAGEGVSREAESVALASALKALAEADEPEVPEAAPAKSGAKRPAGGESAGASVEA